VAASLKKGRRRRLKESCREWNRHRDEGDEGDCKKVMLEVAARQNFLTVGLGLTLASELAKMIPEATGSTLQSPCLLNWTTSTQSGVFLRNMTWL
jgi:hypothetical protein